MSCCEVIPNDTFPIHGFELVFPQKDAHGRLLKDRNNRPDLMFVPVLGYRSYNIMEGEYQVRRVISFISLRGIHAHDEPLVIRKSNSNLVFLDDGKQLLTIDEYKEKLIQVEARSVK